MMWTHKATISAKSGKDYEEQTPSKAGRNGACRPHPIPDKAFDSATVSPRESPTLLRQIQQLRKEILSATTIQSVWRGYRIRRNVDKMNKAATRIQAAYRGHRTRQELPRGFYDCIRYKKHALHWKEKAEKQTTALPEPFQALTPEDRVHDAGHKIWAARGVYQSRDRLDETERQAEKIAEPSQTFIYSYQLRPNSCENHSISELASVTKMQELTAEPQDTVTHPERDLTVKLEPKKEKKESNAEGSAPSIRNINMHIVVKSLPTSKGSISLHVSSPNGAVEGFHRETGSGRLRGLYTVRRHRDSKLFQVCIQANVVEMGRRAGRSLPQ